MRWGRKVTQPIVLWTAGILALLAVLIVRGGFQRPLAFIVWPVLVVGMVLGFRLFAARARQGNARQHADSASLREDRAQPPAGVLPAAPKEKPRPP